MIYFDHNSTTEFSPRVKDFVQNDLLKYWSNPSSSYDYGINFTAEIRNCRRTIAKALKVPAPTLIFTSGATESINTVLSIKSLKNLGVKTIVTSILEHKATLDSLKALEDDGFEVKFVKNGKDGVLDLDDLTSLAKTLKNAMFTFLMVNNETGVINPISDIERIVHGHQHYLHVDAVQALGKMPIDLTALNPDFASFSGHKIGSLKGIGLLYVKNQNQFTPLIRGGGQENGLRSGTTNYAGIKSFELALIDSLSWNLKDLSMLKEHLEDELQRISGVKINARTAPRVLNTINIQFVSQNAHEILNKLIVKKVFVSSGSACSSGSFDGSHVLKGLGLSNDQASRCVRVSLGVSNTLEEVEYFLSVVRELLNSNFDVWPEL